MAPVETTTTAEEVVASTLPARMDSTAPRETSSLGTPSVPVKKKHLRDLARAAVLTAISTRLKLALSETPMAANQVPRVVTKKTSLSTNWVLNLQHLVLKSTVP